MKQTVMGLVVNSYLVWSKDKGRVIHAQVFVHCVSSSNVLIRFAVEKRKITSVSENKMG